MGRQPEALFAVVAQTASDEVKAAQELIWRPALLVGPSQHLLEISSAQGYCWVRQLACCSERSS